MNGARVDDCIIIRSVPFQLLLHVSLGRSGTSGTVACSCSRAPGVLCHHPARRVGARHL